MCVLYLEDCVIHGIIWLNYKRFTNASNMHNKFLASLPRPCEHPLQHHDELACELTYLELLITVAFSYLLLQ